MNKAIAVVIVASVFGLTACVGTMNGIERGSGEPILVAYSMSPQHDDLQVTMPDGEAYAGKAVMVGRSTGISQAVLFGDRGGAMHCKLQYASSSGYTKSGGVGVCEATNGQIIDIQW